MASWIPIPENSDFTLANIPLAIVSTPSRPLPSPATRVGNTIVFLSDLYNANCFETLYPAIPASAFSATTLNPLFALPRICITAVRNRLIELFKDDTPFASLLRDNEELQKVALTDAETLSLHHKIEYHLPVQIGDYSDFYAGRHHAFRVGRMFRGEGNELQKNYEQLPVGYHGRASSVVVSGKGVRRPKGQIQEGLFRQTEKLDYEIELGAIVGGGDTEMGVAVGVEEAADRIVGYVLLNDWSARDIQSFEYVPLGPFTSKSFITTISAWVILADALAPYRVSGLTRFSETPILPYLHHPPSTKPSIFGLNIECTIHDREGTGGVVAKTNARHLLWSFEQMLAQQTVTGCNVRTGDLLGSGTISGENVGEEGCLLEAGKNGTQDVDVGDGKLKRRWLHDGDKIVMKGWVGSGERRIGWGEGCAGEIMPALVSSKVIKGEGHSTKFGTGEI